jgi:multiple sugar transport system substrate-binding protein
MNLSANRAIIRIRLYRWIAAALAMSLLLSACSKGESGKESAGEPATIKIMSWNEQTFQTEFGMLFYAMHPEIDVKVANMGRLTTGQVDDYEKAFDEFVKEERPDVLMLSLNQYKRYAADGRLVSLESFLTRDKIDLEGFIPGLIEDLREIGGGELYGLTPQFIGQAIYYNKDLFDRFGVEYPTDKMSWEELLNLAARFPSDGSEEERVWGLGFGYPHDLYQLGQRIGTTLGLRLINPADKSLLIDSDAWVKVYEIAHKALRSGAIHQENSTFIGGSYEEYLLSNPFIAGKVAMMLEGSYLMLQLREAAGAVPDKAVKNWDLVTVPVDPSNPDYTHETSYYQIFAINADSPNIEAAWKFIRYIHSDDYARVKSKSSTGQLPIRTKYIQDEEGRNVAAFYALKPSNSDLYAGMDDLPQDFLMQLYPVSAEELNAVMEDKKTVEEALSSIKTRLQAALEEALANQADGGEAAGAGSSSGVAFETGVSVESGASDGSDEAGE